jgi:hypothetical protein
VPFLISFCWVEGLEDAATSSRRSFRTTSQKRVGMGWGKQIRGHAWRQSGARKVRLHPEGEAVTDQGAGLAMQEFRLT